MMTRGDLPRITVWKRPLKPVALGVSLAMLVVFAVNIQGDDRGSGPPLTWLMAAASLVAFAALVGGWVSRSQRLAEAGLILAFGIYVTRAAFIHFASGSDQASAFSLCTAVIAGGAYLLETSDERGIRWTRASRHSSPPS